MKLITLIFIVFLVGFVFQNCSSKKVETKSCVDLKTEDFKTKINGKETNLYFLKNGVISAAITNYGVRIVSLCAPDRTGKLDDVVLGFKSIDGYLHVKEVFYRALIDHLIEVRKGFHHSSDLDLSKPINWKRMIEINGEYGYMADLRMHTLHVPFRIGGKPLSVFADLQKIADMRPDGNRNTVPFQTWDNAVITCKSHDPKTGKEFSMVLETKRMAPGATNNWFIEVYGTENSAKFSTHNPKAFDYLTTNGKEQGWTRIDIGSQSTIPSITGGIFEFGFSDAFQQMIGAFIQELTENGETHPFLNVNPEETRWSHELFTAALKSNKKGERTNFPSI